MACSNGLAPGIDAALELSPIQMIQCLEALAKARDGETGQPGRLRGRQGTPEEFAALFMNATQGQVSVDG